MPAGVWCRAGRRGDIAGPMVSGSFGNAGVVLETAACPGVKRVGHVSARGAFRSRHDTKLSRLCARSDDPVGNRRTGRSGRRQALRAPRPCTWRLPLSAGVPDICSCGDNEKTRCKGTGFLSGVRTGLRIQANQHLTGIKTVSLRSNENLSEGPVSSHERGR
jgi:hypothetical protein